MDSVYKTYGTDLFNIVDSNYRSLLHAAAMAGKLNVIEWILEIDEDMIDTVDNTGLTAFHYAVRNIISYLQ